MATNFKCKWARLAYTRSFVALAFRNRLEYRNAGDDSTMLYINNVSFGPVTNEFTRPLCVQQASSSGGVSLSTFARGYIARHCDDRIFRLFQHYSLGGDTARRANYTLRFATHF